MNETTILANAAADATAYHALKAYGDSSMLSPLGKAILTQISDYYDRDPEATSISADVLTSRLERALTNPKHTKAAIQLVSDFPEAVSTSNFIADVVAFRKDYIGGKLAMALANKAPEADVADLLQQYQAPQEVASGDDPNAIAVLDTADMLDSKADQEKIIKLYPRALNDRCDGGALPGHHILVYARPERGKTLWALNMCAGFMKQMKRVCYFCNEEPIKDYKERLRMRLLKQPKGKLRAEPEKSQAALAAMQLGDLYFIETRSFAQARNHIYRLKPDVVVFDQLRNMETGQEGKTQQLDIAATSARAIAKDYGVLVVSVTQAGDSASGKVYLQMNDVDSSKTGIPAAVDLMIGLGGDDAMQATGLLGVSLPKNKLSGLHEQFVVEYDVSTGVIK